MRLKANFYFEQLYQSVASFCHHESEPGRSHLLWQCSQLHTICFGVLPAQMTLRASFVPEELRSTILNIFRIPLNLFVCLVLYKVCLVVWRGNLLFTL